jgi:hypothetical protein
LGVLADTIRKAVHDERYVFGAHADQRMRERRILGWQVLASLEVARVIAERSDAIPNPAVEFAQLLPDGTPFKAVWSWIESADIAKLVTVHFFD